MDSMSMSIIELSSSVCQKGMPGHRTAESHATYIYLKNDIANSYSTNWFSASYALYEPTQLQPWTPMEFIWHHMYRHTQIRTKPLHFFGSSPFSNLGSSRALNSGYENLAALIMFLVNATHSWWLLFYFLLTLYGVVIIKK